MEQALQKNQDKKSNIKLFPIYIAFSWDLLFYYSISFLFLTQAKGITAATVLFSDAFYPIFKFILQIPNTLIVDKVGKRKSMLLGNLFVAGSLLALIFATGLPMIIFSQFLSAFGFGLKNLVEDNFLYDSIPNSKKRNDLFSKVAGKGHAWYYYLDAISATVTGFLFVFNAYLPMILSFAFCLIAALLCTRFIDVDSPKRIASTQEKKHLVRKTISDLKDGFHFIIKSNRLRSLILIYALLTSLLAALSSLRSSLLTDLAIPEQYFGIIFAVLGIISGMATQRAQWFHNRFRNRTLKILSLTISISMIFAGLCVIANFNTNLCIEIILITFILHYILKGPFYTLIQRYLKSFSTPSMRIKISSASELAYSITRAILSFLCSALLSIASTAYVFVIIGCIFSVLFILLLDYMRDTVGLKPEQYDKKEIEYTEIH